MGHFCAVGQLVLGTGCHISSILPAQDDGRAVKPTRTTVNSHTSCLAAGSLYVVHCRQMGRDRRLPPFQGPVNLGLLNSATPMNGLLSKDTPDLSNNELSLICSGKYKNCYWQCQMQFSVSDSRRDKILSWVLEIH